MLHLSGKLFLYLQLTIDEISAGNNKVTMAWTFTGTHQGEFMRAATGKEVKYSGIADD